MCSVPLPIAAAMIRGVAEWNGVGALALCEVPLLVLNPTGRSNEPSRIRPLHPSMHIGATVGAGHFHQLEVPDQVNAMIERFLAIAVCAAVEIEYRGAPQREPEEIAQVADLAPAHPSGDIGRVGRSVCLGPSPAWLSSCRS